MSPLDLPLFGADGFHLDDPLLSVKRLRGSEYFALFALG
jgi:hypothetical protein